MPPHKHGLKPICIPPLLICCLLLFARYSVTLQRYLPQGPESTDHLTCNITTMINLPAINWDDKVLSKRQLNKTRYYIPCPGVQFRHGQNANKPQACKECGRFHPRCCRHKLSCHDNAIVYVDGACSKNGNNEARSGIGYALGIFKEQQFSLPVTKARDYDGPRTSQRAELLAAYHGLIGLRNDQRFNVRPERETGGAGEHGKEVWVVAMDSEYVVKGVAEYYPQWKVRLPSFASVFFACFHFRVP